MALDHPERLLGSVNDPFYENTAHTPRSSLQSTTTRRGACATVFRAYLPGSFSTSWQGVLEVIGVLAAGDDDSHGSCDAGEPSRARARHHGDGELKFSLVHRAGVLEGEGASVAVKGSGDVLNSHVTGVAFGGVAGPKHLALTGSLEIAVELLVEGVTADVDASGGVIRRERRGFYLEGSSGAECHGDAFPKSFGSWRLGHRVGRPAETCPKHDTRENPSFDAHAATSLGGRSIFPQSVFQGSPPSGSSQPIRYLRRLAGGPH